jgi:hypothetical protein
MAIGSDYPTPVTVNGYSCKNCTDVRYAKKHVDPAHPRSGPYGINAKNDPSVSKDPAIIMFGGSLAALNAPGTMTAGRFASENVRSGVFPKSTTGTQLDLLA